MRDMARIINERYAADDNNDENDDNNNDVNNTEKIRSDTDGNKELQKIAEALTNMSSTLMKLDSMELRMVCIRAARDAAQSLLNTIDGIWHLTQKWDLFVKKCVFL